MGVLLVITVIIVRRARWANLKRESGCAQGVPQVLDCQVTVLAIVRVVQEAQASGSSCTALATSSYVRMPAWIGSR